MTPRTRTPEPATTAVAVFDPAQAGRALSAAVNDRRPQLAALLGVELESERGKAILDRFVTVALHAATSNPDLLRASKESLVESIRDAAMLGLEPVGATGDGAIVVYDETRKEERAGANGGTYVVEVRIPTAHFQPMYRGLLKLARRSDQVAAIDAHVVFEGDAIELDLGSDPFVRHSPSLAERGRPLGAYAVAELRNGRRYVDWMTYAEIEVVRKKSRARNAMAWTDFWTEMARKTVLRRLMKRLPLETTAEHAMRLETDAESLAALPSGEAPAGEIATTRARLRARLGAPEVPVALLEEGAPVSDAPGAAEDPLPPPSTAPEVIEPARPVAPADAGICGSGSDPELGPVDVCNLAPDHSGRVHKKVDRETGEVIATWPKK